MRASDLAGRTGSPADGALRALHVAQHAAAHVPAYAAVLRRAGYDPAGLRTVADFARLPLIDKDSYLGVYSVDQCCPGEQLTRAQIVTLSSGSSGGAALWPRFAEQDAAMLEVFRALFEEHFRIHERRTLLVVGIPLGAWVAGATVAAIGQRLFARPDLMGTVVTPGPQPAEILRFVEALSPLHDQTILTGSSTPRVLAEGARRGLCWPALNVSAIMGGEWLSEERRLRILEGLGKDPDRLEGFVGLFVSAEAGGIIGYETRLCLLLRRLCVRTPALAEALFGSVVLPSFHQYDPHHAYLEVVEGEILLTKGGALPLVRYNTHDCGGLLSLDEVLARCREHGYDLLAELAARGYGPEAVRPLPFLYVFGRSDAVIVYRANVSLHHVAHVLESDELHRLASGSFELGATTDPDGNATLEADIELAAGVAPTPELTARVQQRLLEGLLAINSEFRDAYRSAAGRLRLAARLVPWGTFGRGLKQHRRVRRPGAEG